MDHNLTRVMILTRTLRQVCPNSPPSARSGQRCRAPGNLVGRVDESALVSGNPTTPLQHRKQMLELLRTKHGPAGEEELGPLHVHLTRLHRYTYT